MLITISGLDGSGKSTQIELLKDFLEKQGKSFYYFHAVEFSIAQKLRPNLSSSLRFGLSENESVTKANWLQIQFRKIALLIDIFRFRRLMKKLKVDYIISDRYFYDSVVNICYLSVIARERSDRGNPVQCKVVRDCFASLAMTIIQKFIPKPDLAFFIKVSPEKIMQRERKPDQGMEYLMAKEKIFSVKIKDWDMAVLDGEKSKEEVFDIIKSNVMGVS